MDELRCSRQGTSNLAIFVVYFTGTNRLGSIVHRRGPNLGESLSTMPTTRHCLLIVDDEPNVCDSVHDLLRREFRVLKANSAEEGYRICRRRKCTS